jgi:hypothetical protein
VAVATEVTAWPGWDTAAVDAATVAAIADHLNPATYGQPPLGEEREWVNDPVVRYLEVAEAINRTPGVHYITALTLNGGTADVALPGRVALPEPGAITVDVNP